MIFLGVLASINAGSLIVALWQAYLARNVSTDLQESSYIFVAMALILMVAFIGVPVIIISIGNNAVSYFISAYVIFAICMSILVLIYVPKWKAFRERKKMGTNTLHRFGSSSLQSDDEGINILWYPKDQQEAEEKNRELTKKLDMLQKENEEFKAKMQDDSGSVEEGVTRRT